MANDGQADEAPKKEQAEEPKDKAEAEKIIREIATERGHLDESFLAKLNPEHRPTIEHALRAAARTVSKSINTLATNLYSSDARFVFELLQNADDNKFTRATARGEDPFVSFQVREDRIVIECNEDGFTKKDIDAISSVGESSKSGLQGYIGAKGIGFKSVFIAAWKVHIQSGYYSFCFQHRAGSEGLGMITPVWTEPEDNLAKSVTRITLHLHNDSNTEKHRKRRENIEEQLLGLEQTCLLFLQKLRRIEVKFYDQNDVTKSRVLRVSHAAGEKITVEAILGSDDSQKQRYHVTKYIAKDIASSEDRTAAPSETEIVLAFPLSDKNKPLVDTGTKRRLFAFLPIRETDFEFIIHADFDTIASREDIQEGSQRNRDLRDAVAAAFVQAAREFLKDVNLRYTWPLFLPSRERHSKFWSPIVQKFEESIARARLVRSRRIKISRFIGEVMILDEKFQDHEGKPLLESSNSGDNLISPSYGRASLARLQSYGLKTMNYGHFMELLREDLDRSSEDSRMKSSSTSESWHSKVASLLEEMHLELGYTEELKSLDLLPMADGTWVAATRGPIYLGTTQGISIPPHLRLAALEPNAVRNKKRLAFFSAILDQASLEAPISEVKRLILDRYQPEMPHVPLDESKDDLHYLYLVHYLSDPSDQTISNIKMYDRSLIYVPPMKEYIYYPARHPFGPEMLLECPDFTLRLIHDTYLQDIPVSGDTTTSSRPHWKDWLRDCVGVEDRLSLLTYNKNGLSEAWNCVAKNRQSELLGLLEHLWKHERDHIRSSKALQDALLDTEVLVLGGNLQKLSTVYLPDPRLCELSAPYLEPGGDFPFLQLPDTQIGNELHRKWSFLYDDLKLKKFEDRLFYNQLLLTLRSRNEEPQSMTRVERVFHLYAALYGQHISDSTSQSHSLDQLREAECILVLDAEGRPQKWARPEECVWEGPSNMTSKHPLRKGYESLLRSNPDQLDYVSRFVRKTLNVGDANCMDLVMTLWQLKGTGKSLAVSEMSDLYDYLHKLALSSGDPVVDKDDISRNLEDFGLICVDGSTWHKTSHCLWSSDAELENKVNLGKHYPDLESFFVKIVGVEILTIQMVVKELCNTDANSAIDKVKDTIWSLNSLAQTDASSIDFTVLKDKPIFAVVEPDGQKSLKSFGTQFSIADREHLAAKFSGKLRFLDYTVDEVRKLDVFLTRVGLRIRFMSATVKEFTTVTGDNGRELARPDRALKFKAHAILRLAATFRSPRYSEDMNALYETLRTARVLAIDAIGSELRVSQDDREVVAETTSGDVHIDEEGSKLTVYVPLNRRKQALCFADALPAALVAWLMRDRITAESNHVNQESVSALASILAVDPSVVDDILDRRGIMTVPIANTDPVPPEDTQSWDVDSPDDKTESARDDLTPTNWTPSASFSAGESIASPSSLSNARRVLRRLAQGADMTISHDQNGPEIKWYRAILDRVVRSARETEFPSNGAFSMSALMSSLPRLDANNRTAAYDGNEARGFRSSSEKERDLQIGAAGELYVFEALKRLNLSNLSREDWQSKIRGRVHLHADYADIQDWPGNRETADIVYSDADGLLTKVLIEKEYFGAERWNQARPEYYIEVKTTTGARETPFFISKAQYGRIKFFHDCDQTTKVYLICRVFGLASRGIGMAVYVDPEQMKIDGRLEFTEESWSVAPRY